MGESPGKSQSIGDEGSMLVEQAKELQEAAASLVTRTSSEEDALRRRVALLDSQINSVRSRLRSSKDFDKLEDELMRARYILSEGDAAAFLPNRSHGRFLKMFLGPINVRANRKDVQLKVKEEYNNFRDRTAFLFLCFPSLMLMLGSWIWDGCLPSLPVQLYQAWLLYLYSGLALRENILRVNGSDIRPWWIKHHYCAMAMALISLTWEIERGPDCSQKQRGVQLFLKWAIMQGVVMLLQNRYQRQRLYTRIALGKARRMDVVWGETAGVAGQLLLLCPILFVLQNCYVTLDGLWPYPLNPNQRLICNFVSYGGPKGFEAYVGVLLLKTAVAGFGSDWQVITCGVLLIVMAVGNFANTVQTLVTKSRVKAKIKRGKSRQELNQASDDKGL